MCVRACMCTCVCVFALRIVSKDKTLCFRNTFIIITSNNNWREVVGGGGVQLY